MAYRRDSRVHNQDASTKVVDAALKECFSYTEGLAKKLVSNEVELEQDDLDTLKAEVLNVNRTLAELCNRHTQSAEILERLTGKRPSENQDHKAYEDELRKDVEEHMTKVARKFKADRDPYVREIVRILAKAENEDDFEMVDQELREVDFICPFTQIRLVEPMKNQHCIHRLSKTAFEQMLSGGRNGVFNCPVAGCPSKWSDASTQRDIEFDQQIVRFERLREATEEMRKTQRDEEVEDIDDDDD